MLVSQPKMSTETDCIVGRVGVPVGGPCVGVAVGEAFSVFVAVIWEMTVTSGVAVPLKVGGGMMRGVAVTIPGVCDGTGVQTGKGCGGAPHVSHPASMKTRDIRMNVLLMRSLYLCVRSHAFSWVASLNV
ncbi:MAG: hypothetical protein DPW18_07440 [Chloroflexi bacterium]|nr:MAG: hypothetical protein EDM79_21070 [Chloroflexota bacterium]MCQ3936866.1 hypothetical protein [Chloroflexota bacterium]